MEDGLVKIKLEELNLKLKELEKNMHISDIEKEVLILEEQTSKLEFWNDSKEASKIVLDIKEKRDSIDKFAKLNQLYFNTIEIYNLLTEENELDKEMYKEMTSNLLELEKILEGLEQINLFSKEYDNMNSIVTVHPGAGGTESADWAAMLYRMYTRWATIMNFEIELYDMQDGEEAGIKSVTFNIKGKNSYGYMKCEKGVHRLVRISPFDSNSRRHTSFAAVEVIPEIDDSIVVDIKSEDLDIGTYRASGAGRTTYKQDRFCS